MLSIDEALEQFRAWHELAQPHSYWLALSGGMDSMALLALLARFRAEQSALDVRAVYVDHGWHRDSVAWGAFCVEQGKRFGIPVDCHSLNLPVATGESLEAQAREGRYHLLRNLLPERAVLLTAHHHDDQVETFFLQLLRGAGLEGLACMPAQKRFGNGQWWRPFLQVSRETIEHFVQAQGLAFVDDPSNADTRFQRNRWRHALLPLLTQAFPHIQQAVGRSVAHLQSALQWQHQQLEQAWHAQSALPEQAIFRLTAEFDAHLLRYAITRTGVRPPPEKRFVAFCRSLTGQGHSELRWDSWVLVRHQQWIYLYRYQQPEPPPSVQHVTQWAGIGRLVLHHLPATYEMHEARWALYPQSALWHAMGTRYPLALKNFLQNQKIPPYLRRRLPLLFLRERLVWVGGFGAAEGMKELGVEWQEQAHSVKIPAYQSSKSLVS